MLFNKYGFSLEWNSGGIKTVDGEQCRDICRFDKGYPYSWCRTWMNANGTYKKSWGKCNIPGEA